VSPFSIVVVLHDSAGPLPALLASLGQLPSPPQLIVVDTASSDDGPALARAAGAEVVELGENPGSARPTTWASSARSIP
jgi:GT2 family glycosyltransferase